MASLPDPLRDRRKREDSDDDEGSLKRPRMENQQDRSVDAEVEPMPAVGTSPEIKAVAAAIMKVESDIANVERSIEKVEKQIETASQKAAEADDQKTADRWWKKEEDLRKEKEDLRKKEEDLRARLAAKEKLLEGQGLPKLTQLEKQKLLGEWLIPSLDPAKLSPELLNREYAFRMVQTYLGEVLDPKRQSAAWDHFGGKSKILTLFGVKGTGKTRLLRELQRHDWGAVGGYPVRTTFVSYNEGNDPGDYIPVAAGSPAGRAFGRYLLSYNACPKEVVDEVESLREAIAILRRKLEAKGCVLLVGVDEIVVMKDGPAQWTLSAVMAEQDRSLRETPQEPVIFIFSAMLERYMDEMMSGSGRPVYSKKIGLYHLPLSEAHALLPEDLTQAMITSPAVKHMVLSCLGHPRALFDGLPRAWERECRKRAPDTRTLVTCFNVIASECKLDSVPLKEEWVRRWLNPCEVLSDDEKDIMKHAGLLHEFAETLFILPLLLHRWAFDHEEGSPLAHHLLKLYNADTVLESTHEKKMEDVMAHFDAVRRCAIGHGNEVSLQKFFRGAAIGILLKDCRVQLHLPDGEKHVEYLDIEKSDLVNSQLREGYIVVASSRGQPGFEYLIPFKNPRTDKLLVAAVQCKYVTDGLTESWRVLKEKITRAVQPLRDADASLEFFPVFYTTVDQQRVSDQTAEGAVVFTKSTLFEYTQKVGILRLHLEKLRGIAAKKFGLQ